MSFPDLQALVDQLGPVVAHAHPMKPDGFVAYTLIFPEELAKLNGVDACGFAMHVAKLLPGGQFLLFEKSRAAPKTHHKMYGRYKPA
jgi:hypothetical protein